MVELVNGEVNDAVKGNVANLFPIPLHIIDDAYDLNDDELKCIHNSCQVNLPGGGNIVGYTCETPSGSSEEDVAKKNWWVLEEPELQGLKKFLQKQVDIYFFEIMKVKKDRNYEFYITQSWYNYNKKKRMNNGRYEYMNHVKHWHMNSMLSAVFIIQTDGTPLVFHKDFRQEFNLFPMFPEPESYNSYNSTTMSFNTKPNTLYLFPSTLSHSVPNNESDIDRITLSFNTFVKGYLGDNHQRTGLVLK